MSGYTKGPWKVLQVGSEVTRIVGFSDNGYGKRSVQFDIAEVRGKDWVLPAEIKANTNLIAAAPELLEDAVSTDQGYDWFLSQLTDFRLYQGSWSLENGDNWAASIVAHIKSRQIGTKAAIAKAEGK